MRKDLMRFNPFNDTGRLQTFRGFEDFFRDLRLGSMLIDFDAESQIKLDVSETDQAYTVKAEIPGAKKEDIKIDIEKSRVSISAETRKETEEKEGERDLRSERYYGQQYRSFTLGNDIDDATATAKYENGVLELLLPKKTKNGGKKLIVK
jgi:HSP20 family protein